MHGSNPASEKTDSFAWANSRTYRMIKAAWFGLGVSQFVACFTGLGTVYSFGYWVPPLLDEFGGNNAQTQVIMAVFQCGFFLGGIPAKIMLHRWGFRAVYLAGGATASVTFFCVSFAPTLWSVYFIFFASAGMQASWMVSGSLIPRHMPTKVATRLAAFSVTGSGIGTMAWANISRALLPAIGWRASFRVMSLCFAVLYAFGAVWMKAPPPFTKQESQGPSGYKYLLTDSRCRFMFASMSLAGAGYMMTFAVQGAHAKIQGLSMDEIATCYTMFGLFSLFSRIGAGILGSRVNPLHVWAGAKFFLAVSVCFMAWAKNFWMFAVANALLGIFSGPMIALMVPALQTLVGTRQIPEALVVGFVVQAFSTLPAPALAGWIADMMGSYTVGLMFGAVSVLAGAACVMVVVLKGPREELPAEQSKEMEADAVKSENSAGAGVDLEGQSTKIMIAIAETPTNTTVSL
mmetsp:Transcript_92828/g.298535  ORF Transcript_92828/g.298535 Transcript_92828/m.298535 type:complete len:461 (-) Transcript_92828:94-1476(-)